MSAHVRCPVSAVYHCLHRLLPNRGTNYVYLISVLSDFNSCLLGKVKTCQAVSCLNSSFNPLYTGRLFHYYILAKSICPFWDLGYTVAFILFLVENPVSKQ